MRYNLAREFRSERNQGGGNLNHERLVDLIYALVEEETGLQSVVVALADALGTDKGHLFVLGPRGEVLETRYHGYDPGSLGGYHENFQDDDPRIHLGMSNLGRFQSDVEVIDPASFERSTVFNELLAKVDIRYSLFGIYRADPDTLGAQAVMRSRRAGPFEREEVGAMQRLAPHFARAVRLRRLLASMRSESSDLRRALDLAPSPVAILEGNGRLVCASARAEPLLTPEHGLRVVGQQLTAVRAKDAAALAFAVDETARFAEPVARSSSEPSKSPAVLELPREERRPLALIFLPLRPESSLRNQPGQRGRVLVVFHDPEAIVRLDPSLIARIHGLTPAEARLASALAEGTTPADFARERGISEQTVRTHLKRLLDKTGTHRQPELVRMLLGSAALQLPPPR